MQLWLDFVVQLIVFTIVLFIAGTATIVLMFMIFEITTKQESTQENKNNTTQHSLVRVIYYTLVEIIVTIVMIIALYHYYGLAFESLVRNTILTI